MARLIDGRSVLRTTKGARVEYQGYIGSGGQGEVHRVSVGGRPKALKWYFAHSATEDQRRIVIELVNHAMPDRRFLWPEALVDGVGVPGFGYVMPLRPDSFTGLAALFHRKVTVKPRELVTVCLLMVEAYQTLHREGIAYRDISWGNVFFEPAGGEVLICDNDNAVFDGQAAAVAGTLEFMAPELVRGDPGARPGVQTDLYSLSVLLFMLLVNHHPLQGERELAVDYLEDEAKKRLYGDSPLFVFDPDDPGNRADEVKQATAIVMWEFIPAVLRALFTRAFTTGLHDPDARVRETEWIAALSSCRDVVVSCPYCHKQTMTEPGAGLDGLDTCWKCGNRLEPVGVLTLTTADGMSRVLMLDQETRVYAHHLGEDLGGHDFQQPQAEVREHPQRAGRFGLTNLTRRPWSAASRDGRIREVLPGRSVALTDGLVITMGRLTATVALK